MIQQYLITSYEQLLITFCEFNMLIMSLFDGYI